MGGIALICYPLFLPNFKNKYFKIFLYGNLYLILLKTYKL